MGAKNLGAFLLLGVIWGSSFLWIKIGLGQMGPFTLVAFRLLFGLIGMAVIVLVIRPSFPRSRPIWIALAVLGITNTALPFTLISWGQQTVDSGVASILNSTVPLWALIIAPRFIPDERMTFSRSLGLVIGFLGVVLILGRDINGIWNGGGLLGQIAILIAAISYAASAVLARRMLAGVHFIVQAFLPVLVADLILWPLAGILEGPLMFSYSRITWLSVLWLGLLGSSVAYLLYYTLIHNIGPTRSTMVTYMFPVVGISLGVLLLGEQLDLWLVVGSLMVIAGIVIVNWRRDERRSVERPQVSGDHH